MTFKDFEKEIVKKSKTQPGLVLIYGNAAKVLVSILKTNPWFDIHHYHSGDQNRLLFESLLICKWLEKIKVLALSKKKDQIAVLSTPRISRSTSFLSTVRIRAEYNRSEEHENTILVRIEKNKRGPIPEPYTISLGNR